MCCMQSLQICACPPAFLPTCPHLCIALTHHCFLACCNAQDFYLATLKQAVLVANPALAGELQQALEDVAAATTPAPTAAAETS